MTQACDILVIGGGITGCATAHYLAIAGATVTLVDKFDLNTHSSGRNAGGLHGQIQNEPFSELGEGWARRFAPALGLMHDSIELWHGLSDELGTELEVKLCGGLIVAATELQMRTLERKVMVEREQGISVELLDSDDLAQVAPYVSERMIGGALYEKEGKANPLLAAPAFARSAKALGASVLTMTDVIAIDQSSRGFCVETTAGKIDCERIVDCAGADVGRVSSLVGVELPIERHAIQLSVTESIPPIIDHLVYFAGGLLTLKQARVGSVLVGGGWPSRLDETGRLVPDLDSLRDNLRTAIEVVPALAPVPVLRAWAGICPGLADQLPIVGELDGVNGFIISMFPFLGFTCGPIMGNLAAKLALREDPGRDLSAFSPSRLI